MSTRLPSDEQIIQCARRAHRYRRPLGLCSLLLGLAGIALIAYGVDGLRARLLSSIDQIAQSAQPAPQQVAQATDEMRFNSGFVLGTTVAGGFAGACRLAVMGVVWLLVACIECFEFRISSYTSAPWPRRLWTVWRTRGCGSIAT